MKTLKALSEKRRNPLQNPTTSAYEKLEKYKNDPDIYVSFTSLPKLGINPNNQYNTPTAIYTYPLKQIWHMFKKGKTEVGNFTDGRPYIQVLRRTGGKFIEDIGKSYSSKDLEKDEAKMRKLYPDDKGKQRNLDRIEKAFQTNYETFKKAQGEALDLLALVTNVSQQQELLFDGMRRLQADLSKYDLANFRIGLNVQPIGSMDSALGRMLQLNNIFEKQSGNDILYDHKLTKAKINWAKATLKVMFNYHMEYATEMQEGLGIEWSIKTGKEKAKHPSAGGQFWNITRLIANGHTDSVTKNAVNHWNKVLRSLGYSGIADKSGQGIIHPAEPTQAIFLHAKAYKQIDMILNKSHKIAYTIKSFEEYAGISRPDFKDFNPRNLFTVNIDVAGKHQTLIIKNKKEFVKMAANDMVKNFDKWYEHTILPRQWQLPIIIFKYAKNPEKLKKNKKFILAIKKGRSNGRFRERDIKAFDIRANDVKKINNYLFGKEKKKTDQEPFGTDIRGYF